MFSSTQLTHSSQKTAVIDPVGSTRVAEDVLRVPDSILTCFVPEIFLTVAFILTNCCGVVVCRDSIVEMVV